MAVTYGFFNSINGDRKYNADQMSDYFRGIVNQGVFQHLDNGLAVSAGTGMEVNVATGRAIVQNKWVQNDMALPLTIEAASDTYGRKDAVVIRLSYTNRNISIVVKTGTPAASPVAPSMTRNSTTYEMALAYVNVAANATSVTVTDKRSDSSVCGWISVAQETSGEVDAMLEAMKTGFDGESYDSPVEMVQGEDQKLQAEIDEVKDGLDDLSYIDISPNVLNPDDYGTAGIIINSQGEEVETEHENWCESGCIPFTSDMVMRVTKKNFSQYYAGQLYDSNKNFIHRAAVTDMTTYFELRATGYSSTAFIRVAVDTSVEFMAVIDQAYPDIYTPYYDPTLSIRPTVSLQLTKRLHTYGVKWAVAGDSWSAENNVLHKYHYYISQELGLNVINTARSGTGWKKKADENRAFCDRVNSIPLDAGLVTILGGGNDCQAVHNGELGEPSDQWDSTLEPLTNNTICAYINHTLDLINARVPLAKLGVIAPGPWSGYPTYVVNNDMEQLVQALKSICALRGIPFLDLYHCSGLRPWDQNQNSLFVEGDASTNTHPNDAGQLFMSPVIREFIKSLLW